jgi:hypothetical protein
MVIIHLPQLPSNLCNLFRVLDYFDEPQLLTENQLSQSADAIYMHFRHLFKRDNDL